MVATLIIFIVVVIAMIASILFFPKIKLGNRISIDTYWIIVLIGAIVLMATNLANPKVVFKALGENTAINPLKILALFISMTMLSIFLDELGFFRYIANIALVRAKSGKLKLFIYLYVTVSILTIFTSNDIIILSFTPFICYFAKNANINPTPYLVTEFVAANTWSMLLIIGNPTNIYIATAYGIDFIHYIKISVLPTIVAGIVSFSVLYLMFKKELKDSIIEETPKSIKIEDKFLLYVGLAHLVVCTIMLIISSYINIEMWLISVCVLASLCVFVTIDSIIRKKAPREFFGSIIRAPYALIPFLLSMFVLILGLEEQGITEIIGKVLGAKGEIFSYGLLSFLTCNIINNIPMSVLFTSIINSANAGYGAVFATIIGSNIGAFLTPIGALAGIMWSNILNTHGQKFGYIDFIKMGVFVSIPTILASICTLYLVLL